MSLSIFAAPFMIFAMICTYFSVQNKAEQLMVPAIIFMLVSGFIIIADLVIHLKTINDLIED